MIRKLLAVVLHGFMGKQGRIRHGEDVLEVGIGSRQFDAHRRVVQRAESRDFAIVKIRVKGIRQRRQGFRFPAEGVESRDLAVKDPPAESLRAHVGHAFDAIDEIPRRDAAALAAGKAFVILEVDVRSEMDGVHASRVADFRHGGRQTGLHGVGPGQVLVLVKAFVNLELALVGIRVGSLRGIEGLQVRQQRAAIDAGRIPIRRGAGAQERGGEDKEARVHSPEVNKGPFLHWPAIVSRIPMTHMFASRALPVFAAAVFWLGFSSCQKRDEAKTSESAEVSAPIAVDSTGEFDPVANTAAVAGGTYTAWAGGFPKSLNFWLDPNSFSGEVMGYLYESLVSLHSTQDKPVGILAKSWEISADGKTFTFHIDPRARWSDGQPVTARDVQFYYDVMMDPHNMTPLFRVDLKRFSRPEVLDSLTVRITATQAHWKNFWAAAGLTAFPAHAWQGKDFQPDQFSTFPW